MDLLFVGMLATPKSKLGKKVHLRPRLNGLFRSSKRYIIVYVHSIPNLNSSGHSKQSHDEASKPVVIKPGTRRARIKILVNFIIIFSSA